MIPFSVFPATFASPRLRLTKPGYCCQDPRVTIKETLIITRDDADNSINEWADAVPATAR